MSVERLLTVPQVAELLGMRPQYIYEKTAAGEIPCFKIGRYTRVRMSDLEAYLQTCWRGPGSKDDVR